jgi:hypothetical protein
MRTEKEKSMLLLRSAAYVDCANSLADLSIAEQFNDNNLKKTARGRFIDAKARIAIYGDWEVAHARAEFMGKYGGFNSAEARGSFVHVNMPGPVDVHYRFVRIECRGQENRVLHYDFHLENLKLNMKYLTHDRGETDEMAAEWRDGHPLYSTGT